MNKINLAILIDEIIELRGGAERQLYEMLCHLNKSKYRIYLISLQPNNIISSSFFKIPDVTVLSFPVLRVYGISGIWQSLRLIHFMKKNKIDIVMNIHLNADILGTITAYIAKVPVILSNRRDLGFWRKPHHVKIYQWLNKITTKILANSKAIITKFSEEELCDIKKCIVIHNGIRINQDYKKVDKTKRELGINPDDKVIIQIANLLPIKGYEYLIEAFSKLKRSDVKLIIIGKDYMSGEIQAISKNLQIENKIKFLGAKNDARAYLSLADICVCSSLSEGLSNSIMEYMAAGKPVISTDVGGNTELITNDFNGIIVPPRNSNAMTDALNKLLTDTSLAKQMGENGHSIITTHFTMQKMVENYEALFDKLLNRLKTPVFVLGMTVNGLSVVRSLGRKGIPVIGFDLDVSMIGFKSKYLKDKVLLKDFFEKPETAINQLIKLAKNTKLKPFLFPTADEFILFISKNKKRLSEYFQFVIQDDEIIEYFLNKSKLTTFCETYNIKYPQTKIVQNLASAEELASHLKYPCFLKPFFSHVWRNYFDSEKGIIVKTPEEMMTCWNNYGGIGGGFLAQQIIEGPDSNIYTWDVLCDNNGEKLFSVVTHKIRQYPPHFGVGCFSEISIQNEMVQKAGEKILSNLNNYKGLISLEFKQDSKTGELFLIEANLRTVLNGDLRVRAGADFPYFYYLTVIEKEPLPKINIKPTKYFDLQLDIGCFTRMQRIKEITFWNWLKEYLKINRCSYAYFAMDDLKPWLVVYTNFTKKLINRLTK